MNAQLRIGVRPTQFQQLHGHRAFVDLGHFGEVFTIASVEQGDLLTGPHAQHLADVMGHLVFQNHGRAAVQCLCRVDPGQAHFSARSGQGCARWH